MSGDPRTASFHLKAYQEFMASNRPAGMQPVTVQYFDSRNAGDPASWATETRLLPDPPPKPEWQYVEDFAGHKLYRRVWEDGREQGSTSLPAAKATLTADGMWGYGATGSRIELRRAILRNRDMPVRRAADGGLVGWRYWTLETWRIQASDGYEGWGPLRADCWLRSPHRGTIWDGPTLSAVEWSDLAACEGHAGIHAALSPAAWPSVSGWITKQSSHITGRVRGYGRYVLGTRGWRAERVVIDYLRVPADIYDEVKGPLSERYACEVRKQWR